MGGAAGAAFAAAAPGVLANAVHPAVLTDSVGSQALTVLNWNIFRGGNGAGAGNLAQLLDQVVALRPDIFFCVETYGAGPAIETALSLRAGKGKYRGVQITKAAPGSDNLWLFSHLPVIDVFPDPRSGGSLGSFNVGGARLRTPQGKTISALTLWLTFTNPWVGYLVDENAAGIRAGTGARHTVGAVVSADSAQAAMTKELVTSYLPVVLRDDDDLVLIGGDLNTLPAEDWSASSSSAQNHFGMSFDFTATKNLTDVGYRDLYRAANPDPRLDEGRTWSPMPYERLIAPNRIDMIFGKGNAVVSSATVIESRMAQHGAGTFYSDHGAVLLQLSL